MDIEPPYQPRVAFSGLRYPNPERWIVNGDSLVRNSPENLRFGPVNPRGRNTALAVLFLVDSSGKIDMKSVAVTTEDASPAFVGAVCKALPKMKYVRLETSNRPILIGQPFLSTFSGARPSSQELIFSMRFIPLGRLDSLPPAEVARRLEALTHC